MTSGPPDVIELLLPDAPAAAREDARRAVQWLRLVAHGGGGARAEEPGPVLAAARSALAHVVRAELGVALEELLDAHVRAALGGDAVVLPRAARRARGAPDGVAEAWRVVEAHRRADAPSGPLALLPHPPLPGEPPLDVARRLLAALAALPCTDDAVRLGEAAVARAAEGPEAGEARHRALLAGSAAPPAFRALAVAGAVECLLDRARVREARALLDAHLDLVACDARLARLLAWAACAADDLDAARDASAGLAPLDAELPRPLAELRARRPATLRFLTGREPPRRDPCGARRPSPAASRRDVGASALLVLALRPGGTAEVVHADVAPGLADRLAAWAEEHSDAATLPGEHEHAVATTAAPLVALGGRGAPPRGALDPRALGVALAPVVFDRGPTRGLVAGWVRLECAHHLLPSTPRLAAIARGWRRSVLEALEARPSRARAGGRAGAPDLDDPRRAVAHELARAIGAKTARRRWWVLAVEGEELACVGEGGEALEGRDARPGGARALRRALAALGPVRFDAPAPALAWHEGAASGAAVPLVLAGRAVGAFVLESARRRDLRAEDVARFAEAARSHAAALRHAAFRAWHRARFGEDVLLPVVGEAPPLAAAEVVALGRARAPAAVVGPEGAGKEVLARWLHLEGAGPDAPLVVVACARDPEGAGRGLAGKRAARGTLVLDRPDLLPPEAQERLAAELAAAEPAREAGARGARVVALLLRPPAEEARAGALRPALARRLGRVVLALPPLAHRRADVPALAELLVRRFAAAEGRRAPRLADDAQALLWRQSWPGNLRDLAELLYPLVLHHPGAEIGAELLAAHARRGGRDLSARLPSRHPDRADLEAALRATRRGTGAWNKTRAALYLGWDPDTLVARMRDLGIGERGLYDEPGAPPAPRAEP